MVVDGNPELQSAGMPVTKAGKTSLGQKRTSSVGHGLWQRTRRAVSGGISAVCSSRAQLAGVRSGGTRWGSRQWSGGWARGRRGGRG